MSSKYLYQHLLSSGMVHVLTINTSIMKFQELILLKNVTYYAIKKTGAKTLFMIVKVYVHSLHQDALNMRVLMTNSINLLSPLKLRLLVILCMTDMRKMTSFRHVGTISTWVLLKRSSR
jgi:hypothetical protein